MVALSMFLSATTVYADGTSGSPHIDALVHAFFGDGNSVGGDYAEVTGIAYVDWMIDIANNHEEVGYSWINRNYDRNPDPNNHDVDCSSFVFFALLYNGYPQLEDYFSINHNAYTTQTFHDNLASLGFHLVSSHNVADLQPGDILLDKDAHVQVYIGNNQDVGAHIDEKGTTIGASPGDDRGDEVYVGNHWDPPEIWRTDNPVRTQSSSSSSSSSADSTDYVACNITDTSKIEMSAEYKRVQSVCKWSGAKINRSNGTVTGPAGKETYYNLEMSGVVNIMRGMGNNDPYWVRSDGESSPYLCVNPL